MIASGSNSNAPSTVFSASGECGGASNIVPVDTAAGGMEGNDSISSQYPDNGVRVAERQRQYLIRGKTKKPVDEMWKTCGLQKIVLVAKERKSTDFVNIWTRKHILDCIVDTEFMHLNHFIDIRRQWVFHEPTRNKNVM